MRISSRFAIVSLVLQTGLAAAATPGGSAVPYQVQTDTLDAGGRASSAAPYSQLDGSIGQFAVGVSNFGGTYSAQHGFVAQILGFPGISTIPQSSLTTIQENNPSTALSFSVFDDIDNTANTVVVTASSSNTTLVPNSGANLTLAGSGTSRTLTVTPVNNQFGAATITLTATDSIGSKASSMFVLTVNPTLVLMTNLTQTCQTASHADILSTLLLVTDAADPGRGNPSDTAVAQHFTLTMTVAPAHGQLKLNSVALGVNGTFTQDDVNNGRVTYFNDGSAFTTDSFTFTAADTHGGTIGATAFNLSIGSVGNSPSLTNLTSPPAINESTPANSTSTSLTFTISDPDNTADKLTVSYSSSNTTLLPNDFVNNLIQTGVQSGASANLGLTIKPAQNHHGTAVVTIQVKNPIGLTAPQANTANVVVNFVNQVSTVPAQTINVNSSTAALPVTLGDLDPLPNGVVLLTPTSDNQAVIPNANIVVGGTPPMLTITVTAGAQTGTANITLTTSGGGAPNATSTFAVTVTAPKSLVVLNTLDSGANSLRDCMKRAQKGDTITFDPNVFNPVNADTSTTITLLSALPTISQGNLTIDASNQKVIVNGSAVSDNGLNIASNGNIIYGLNIIQFQLSGIAVTGANNTIGGNRQLGSGPNGQGLRVSSNGSDGIDITGAAAMNNAVQGSWVGLDENGGGTNNPGNLAGIVIESGATNNTIGGPTDSSGEVTGLGNVVGFNTQEGISVNGAASTGNTIIGNAVGVIPPIVASSAFGVLRDDFVGSRSAGNGAAGVFISQGATFSIVGGTDGKSGNTIGFNGTHGIDVHDPQCQRIGAKGNKISHNSKKGISLASGSNNNVQPPTIAEVLAASASQGSTAARTVNTVTIAGTAPGAGTVEVFNDSGDEGATLLGRSGVANGAWSLASVPADSTLNITATYTDANGNTSEFSAPAAAQAPANPATSTGDADGDGFPDAFEVSFGSDPLDPTSTPFGLPPLVGPLPALAGGATMIKVTFAPLSEVITVSGTLPVKKGAKLNGQTAAVYVSGAASLPAYKLSAKGIAGSGATSFKLTNVKFSKTDGSVSADAPAAKFTAKFTSTGTQAMLLQAAANLVNTTPLPATSQSVNVIVLFNGQLFTGNRTLTYKPKAKAKNATASGK